MKMALYFFIDLNKIAAAKYEELGIIRHFVIYVWYGMGYYNKIIGRKTYLTAVLKAWNALAKDCVLLDGKLGYVQGNR